MPPTAGAVISAAVAKGRRHWERRLWRYQDDGESRDSSRKSSH